MVFPTNDELTFLHDNVDWEDAVPVRIDNRLMRLRENHIVLQNLDQIPNLVAHVQRTSDIFIRRMVQQVGESLENTVYWLRLRYNGENVKEFHLNHRTYSSDDDEDERNLDDEEEKRVQMTMIIFNMEPVDSFHHHVLIKHKMSNWILDGSFKPFRV